MTETLSLLFPHVATTGGITVRVAVSYFAEQSAPTLGRWFWSYHVRIENDGDGPVQLLTRHWHIVDGDGAVHEVRGEGVVGETPVIEPGESFDYVSGCPLTTNSGAMSGSFHFIDATNTAVEATIPRFELLGPAG